MTNMSRKSRRSLFFSPTLVALFLFLATTFFFQSKALADYTWEGVPSGYGLAWSDEFNGSVGSGPDTSVWSYDTGVNQPNSELENYTNSRNNSVILADPKAVDGKSLAIIALDPGGNNGQMGNYTSARIATSDTKIFTYGYMEARVRMPYGQGIWPAFWMLGNDINHGVSWPQSDEIDIMENIGNAGDQGTNHMSLHDGNDVTTYLPLPGGQLYHNAYHTFAANWTANQIQFYVDGNLMATDNPASLSNNWAFNNNPNFFLLNVAVGGSWPGNPDGTTSFPQTMLVDYVRAYQTGFTAPAPVVQPTWRVRCGGDAYTDSQGNVWVADTNFTGGWPANPTTNAITGALPGSGDQSLYQWERYGNTTGGQTLNYAFNVPSGSYQVTLKFAEDYWTAAGQRQFNYSINGTTEATNFDIFSAAGGEFKAVDKVYTGITPNANGQIVINLAPGTADNPKIDAIQIIPLAGNPTATFTPTATKVAQSTWRVVAGGPAHTDCQGNVWAADENFTGGTAAAISTNAITGALPCSTDGALYQPQRYGSPFTYSFNVPSGSYQVTLKFAETYWTAAGQRVFNVLINGTTVLTNFDIFKTTGAQNKAIDEVFNNIAPAGGVISVQLGPASVDNAMVDSIQIVPQPSLTPTASMTPTALLTATPTATASRTFTQIPTSTFTSTPGAGQTTWRVVAGGPAHTDCQGNVWAADENFSGGTAAAISTNAITGALPCSTDGALYQPQRYGNPFTYSFPVPAGNYQVTMKFAETYWTAAAQRVFNVSINGTQVLTNFDIFKTTGAQNKAIDEVFSNISPIGGNITVTFGPASVDNAMVDSIQIIPQPATPTPTPIAQKTWRVVAGGPAHTDCQGNVWSADENFTGGTAATSTNAITGALPCSTDGALYQDQRYGSPFTYAFAEPAGNYTVTLKFAETYWTAAGQRVFNVSINGTQVLTNFDIFATAGGQNKAIDEAFNVTSTGAPITVTFGPASVNYALISSLQVAPQTAQAMAVKSSERGVPATPTATATPTPVLPAVSVWPNISKGGQPILFKVDADQGSQAQLSLYTVLGEQILQTSFAGDGHGGYLWHLQNQAGSQVASGLYIYVLKFEQQGQPAVYRGKLSVIR